MRLAKALLIAVLVLSTCAFAETVTGTTFPYARISLNTPPLENPYPGMGSYYSALSKGIKTVLWNPASLAKIEHAETDLAFINEIEPANVTYNYETSDQTMSFGSQGNETLSTTLYFTGDVNVTTAATREHTFDGYYNTNSTGINFKQALRVNDWLNVGVISRGHTNIAVDMSGDFPLVNKLNANFAGSSTSLIEGLNINEDGYLTFTFTPEGADTGYTVNTPQPLWSGFLEQESTVPYHMILEARNDIQVNSDITLSGAMQRGNLSLGLNVTPISATANVNNKARAVIDEETPDIVLYKPNFDPENELDTINWFADETQYTSEIGYIQNYVRVPDGEIIADACYKGFYSANTMRLDLGLQHEVNDWLTLGLALENIGGANLNFQGSGRLAYVNSRISTEEPTGLADPTADFNWDLFLDNFATYEGTEDFYLEEQLTVEIPKKMRLGFAIKKPILVAIDYESNQTPIRYQYTDEDGQPQTMIISNLNLWRIGTEMQVLFLPAWIRSSVTLVAKPSLANADAQTEESFNTYFQYGILPLDLNNSLEINFWGYLVGNSFGINASSLLALAQFDTMHQSMNKLLYTDLYLVRGPWQFSYLMALDPALTAGAYANRTTDEFQFSMLKWIQTISIGYRF
ncbi:MAG: hypothetical protein ABH823_04560 [bacterium]